MARISLEELDNRITRAENLAAIISLGSSAATLAVPNPITGSIALGSNIAGAGIDLYQGIRALQNKDYPNAIKNGGELILSLLGTKYLKDANKLYKLDKTLNSTNVTRNYITKNVGRGKGRHKITLTKELDKAMTNNAIGFSSSITANASSLGSNLGKDYLYNVVPQDNTRNIKRRILKD